MISDIIKEGEKRGFSSVEASKEKIEKYEFVKSGDMVSEHTSDLQRVYCRSMYEYGDPVNFVLSSDEKKGVTEAFRVVSRTFPLSGSKNFRNILPEKAKKVRIEIYDNGFDTRGVDDFKELADETNENILNFPGLRLNTISVTKLRKKFYLLNNSGFNEKYRKTLFSVSINMSLHGNSLELSDSRVLFNDLEPLKLVTRGYTLLDSLTDNIPDLKKFNDLVFSPESSAVILKAFSKYFFPDYFDVASKVNYPRVLNISDDPLLNYGEGSFPFDDEGVQMGETEIIRRGVFRSPLTDLKTSFDTKFKPTGNGFRKGSDRISPNFTNLFIKPTIVSVNTILNDNKETLLISLVKPVSSKNGEFIFSAYGYMYKNNERGKPVRVFFSTTFQDFFLNIERISKEIRFFYSGINIGSPYLFAKSKKIGERLVKI